MRNSHSLVLLAVLFVFLLPGSCLAGKISFQGQFDPSLAIPFYGGGDGSVDWSGAPGSIQVVGSDTDSGTQRITRMIWQITVPVSLAFAWSYSTDDWDPSYDPAGYFLNSEYVQFTNDGGLNNQGAGVSLTLAPGDLFGFYVDATDDQFGRAELTISDAVPEPATAGLVGLGIAAVALFARRRVRR